MSKPSEISIGTLEEEAHKRRQRLKALKRKQQIANTKPSDDASATVVPPPTFADNDEQMETEQSTLVDEDVVAVIESELDTLKEPLVIEDIDITNLAPRKPDWDLKRDVAKKLEILDKRTQRVIAELIRDRLKSNQDTVDLQAVNVLSGGFTQK